MICGTHPDLAYGSTNSRYVSLEREIYEYSHWGAVLFIALVGITGNVLLFIMMGDNRMNYLSYSVYLKFLAVSDSLLLALTLLQDTEKTFSLQRLILLNSGLCKLMFSLRILLTNLSPWLVVGLSLDRYVCICFPLTRERLCTRMKAIIVCSTVLGLLVVLIVPFLVDTELIQRRCKPSEELRYYYICIRTIISSTLPCLLILVLNVLILFQIQQSRNFRKRFTRSGTDSASPQQDRSTRPLVLVSVLAFVTLLPLSVSEAVETLLKIVGTDSNSVALNNKLRSFFILIYILNFGQNFYILIGTSTKYRAIIRARFDWLKWNRRNEQNQAMTTIMSPDVNCPGSGTTELSLVSITSGNNTSAVDANAPGISSRTL
ncbi:prolactin-releasing peptide receptor-like [Gigantopelta aegis]|uniref:prolactin-releasing peptide receptor-like n=1 Tax=Gigantopelta aegis TaxID=1735272 RepID=UPI001B88A383|nr:prolactin-releasing peptide receptor-like [Gigantopelta aegis]